MRQPERLSQYFKRKLGQKWSRPTTYHGIEFRSYLESRFAWHLDSMDEDWIYEPRVYGGYLPDFEVVSAARPTFIEVKPTRGEVEGAQERMEVIWRYVPDALLIVACGEGCLFFSCQPSGQWVEWQERWRNE